MKTENVPKILPNAFLKLATAYLTSTKPVDAKPIMIWGPPGIGKSDVVEQLAVNLGDKLKKRVVFTDVRLSLYSSTDLKGIPYPDKLNQYTQWLRPDFLRMNDSEDVVNVLFFDELTTATSAVATAAYQLILNRQIASHKLPDNCYILCAGNRLQDKAGTNKMLAPLANRLAHFEFDVTLNAWKEWALQQDNFDPRVLDFLNWKPDYLFETMKGHDQLAFPTPRSWASVAKISYGKPLAEVRDLLSACVGKHMISEFVSFEQCYADLPDLDSILDGSYILKLTAPDMIYACIGALRNKLASISDITKFDTALSYLFKYHKEYQIIAIRDFMQLENTKWKLLGSQVYATWCRENSNLYNKSDSTNPLLCGLPTTLKG